MTDRLAALVRAGALEPIDAHFARLLGELDPAAPDAVTLAAAAVSEATREGHTCLSLARLSALELTDAHGAALALALPAPDELRELLLASAAVGDGSDPTPLVLDRDRLYLRRFWQHERALAAALHERAGAALAPLVPELARASLGRLFGPAAPEWPDRQRVAAMLVALRALTVIIGGPGTGKTSTVVRVVAMVVEQALGRGEPAPRVLLLAPTGKAASRMIEAVRSAKTRLPVEPSVLAAIPEQASTIHRALGAPRPGIARRPRRRATLVADLVVVDEASMIDLALMRRLVEAVPATARLVLLGDRHQLASVEAGAVLADLVGPPPLRPYSRALAADVEAAFAEALPGVGEGPGALADSLVELTESHRFDAASGIGRLAGAILAGDVEAAIAACSGQRVRLVPREAAGPFGAALSRTVVDGFAPYLAAADPPAALAALGRFRVLAAHRRGPDGVDTLNERIERALAATRGLRPRLGHYHLRPVLITANDSELGIYNGDVGVIWAAGDAPPRCWLGTGEGTVRSLSPARLPPHETTFAMSIHKSQGSELHTVAIVLPEPESPLLTRELVYTAVTRAREQVVLFGSEASLRRAVARRIERATGLGERLWSG